MLQGVTWGSTYVHHGIAGYTDQTLLYTKPKSLWNKWLIVSSNYVPLYKGFNIYIFHFKYLFRILQATFTKILKLFVSGHLISFFGNKRPGRQWWWCGLKRASAADRLLGMRVEISPGAWMSISYDFWVYSDSGFSDGLIPCAAESCRLCTCRSV